MRRLLAALLAVALLVGAYPVREKLRASAPAAPSAERLGVGRLWGGVLTGAFRPLLLNYLFLKADILYGQGRIDELALHLRMMTSLYPGNGAAREYLGWLLAYNLKEEAPDPELAWTRAREGLEILLATPSSYRAVSHWFLKQCGQNVLDLQRYAGPAWEAEKRMRALVRPWTDEHFGAGLSRFAVGLVALGDSDAFFDRIARAHLLLALVVDEWVRTGRSTLVSAAVAANRWAAGPEGFADNPSLALHYAQQARLLEELERGEVTERVLSYDRYEVAIALFALGAHRRDSALLRHAQAAFERYPYNPCPDEKALVQRWIAYVEGGSSGERPSLPFDGPP